MTDKEYEFLVKHLQTLMSGDSETEGDPITFNLIDGHSYKTTFYDFITNNELDTCIILCTMEGKMVAVAKEAITSIEY